MKWEGNRESDNVEDRRAEGGNSSGAGGGLNLGGLGGLIGSRFGIGGVVVLVLGGWAFGISPLAMLNFLSGGSAPVPQQAAPHKPPEGDKLAQFVSTVLADTEDVWRAEFAKAGGTYQEPRLVLFRGATPTACGQGQSAMGPFYCPGDQKVYIDLNFYQTLKNQLGAPGEFAQAYVVAHEVGHHVQNLLGISAKVQAQRNRVSQAQGNQLSVRLELQADCFAGLWAHHANRSRQILEGGDVEAAMNAAAKIGDDALQKSAGGQIVPESFTHGTSAQRQRWFNTGLQGGSIRGCDTFSARTPL